MSRNTPTRVSPSTSSTTSPTSAGSFGKSSVTSRPTIWRTSSSTRRLGDRGRVDVRAVAHHGDRVAEREDLVEAVGDEQEGAAFVAEAPRDGEEALDLDAAESAAVGSSMISTRASSEMAFAISMICWSAIERPSVIALGVERDAEPREDLRRLLAHRLAVDAADAVGRLAAHEDVLGHRQIGEERRLLVDHGDAGGLGLRGAVEVDGFAVEQELPGVAAVEPRDDLDERGLARAVLADQRMDGSAVESQASRAQGHDGTEGLTTRRSSSGVCGAVASTSASATAGASSSR